MSGSSHIRSDLISVEYRNWRRTLLDVYLLFFYSAWAYSIKTKLQTCNLQTGQSISYKCVNQFLLKLGSVAGPVIQANGRLAFEDDLRSGGRLCFHYSEPASALSLPTVWSH